MKHCMIVLAAAPMLAACTVGPNFERPTPWWSVSSWFRPAAAAPEPTPSKPVTEPFDPHWWTVFKDPQLTGLEDRLVAANLDIRVAETRLAEAREQLGIVAAGALPQVNANASYIRQQQSRNGGGCRNSSSRADNSQPQWVDFLWAPGHV